MHGGARVPPKAAPKRRARRRARAGVPGPCRRRKACLQCLLVYPQLCPCPVRSALPSFGRDIILKGDDGDRT
jgi:hypothetical protein